jgi:hypothetical protein
MARAEQTEIQMRIVIEQPVTGVPYSLQSKDDGPLGAKRSVSGEALEFDFPVKVAAGPRFFGEQVRREGPVRRFVYIRIGQLAGDPSSPWSRRIKVDIHDLAEDLLNRAAAAEGVIELRVAGTGRDGTPACATVPRTCRIK